MKFNGTNNFITDQDILVTSDVGAGDQLYEVIKKQQKVIDELKSNVKWIYKYGGVGSGSGSGSGKGGNWKASISINKQNVANNSVLDLSPYTLNDVVVTLVTVTISNPSAGGYRFAVQYKYDGSDYQSVGTPLTVDNSYSCTFNVKFTMNSTISIKVTDIENIFNEYNINYYIFGYDCFITPLYKNDDGSETLITTLNIKSGNYKNGITYRLNIHNYAGFTISYEPVSTLPFELSLINKAAPTEYNNTVSETESYYLLDENKGFIPSTTNEVILDYLIPFSELSKESNFGALVFRANLKVITNGKVEETPYVYEYNNIPDANEFIIYSNDSTMGSLYTNNSTSISDVDFLYTGNTVTIKFRPFNYTNNTVILQYTLTDAEDNVYTGSFSIVNGRYTSKSFPVYNGWNKLSITGLDDTLYYYGKQLDVSIDWYSNIDMGALYSNKSKSDMINQSFFRFDNSLSENLNNVSILRTAKTNGYYKSVKTTNETTTKIDLWGTNTINNKNNVFGSNNADMHIAIGMQYSAANDFNKPILSISDENDNTLFELYRENISCNTFTNDHDGVNIYIPTTTNFTISNKEEFHLIDIYIRRLKKVTLVERNAAEQNVEVQKDIWAISTDKTSAQDISDKWQVQVYIDGITDGVLTSFVSTFPQPKFINIYDTNAYYNLFEISQCVNNLISFTNVDAVLYWYTYRQYMTKNTGINSTKLSLITKLANIEASGVSPTIKHNLVKITLNYLDTISGNSDMPIYIINVPHLNSDALDQTVFLWLNKEYSENEPEANIISWPVLSTTDNDGNHYTGISYYAAGSNQKIDIKFPSDSDWKQTLFMLDLQGSSTRKNHGKNLDLGLVNNSLKETTFLYSPNYSNGDTNTFLPESKFTLKADVVDSGHSNNAVMGKFINDNTTKFNTNSTGVHKDYVKNCLTGYSCIVVLAVDYQIDGAETEYYYLGIYSFNLGRSSYSNLGYRDVSVFDGQLSNVSSDKPFCFYENSSENLALKNSFGCAEITGGDNKYDFSQWDNSILFRQKDEPEGNTYMWGDFVTKNEGILQNAISYFVRDVALSGGYIFNALGKTAIDHSDWDGWHVKNSVPDVKKLYYKKSDFVSYGLKNTIDVDSDAYNWQYMFEKTIHDAEIDGNQYFSRLDYVSALEYYTICMAFGLVDSVQKNLNIKTWSLGDPTRKDPTNDEDRAKFYISFYDMDTCLGIDNKSNDTSPFCFSDYWDSNQLPIPRDDEDTTTWELQSINIYRDYFDKDSGEVGYDIPSSFLFAIVKYGTSVYNKLNENKIDQADYLTPNDLWARYRVSNAENYSNLGVGVASLSSTDKFMDNYYKKHLEGASEIIFNMNYDAKYVVYKLEEQWTRPSDDKKATDIGTYKLSTDLINFQDSYHQDLTQFRGRSINRVQDWLSSRIHILDAYFNMTNATDYLSVNTEDEQNRIAALSLYSSSLKSGVSDNKDVQTEYQIFNYGSQTKFSNAGTQVLLVKALKYTPLMFIDAGTIKLRYILLNPGYTYLISLNTTGNIDMVLAGSLSLTYLSSITWVHPKELSITSDYLTQIVGQNPITNVKITNINCSALQKLALVGSTYSGTIKMEYNDAIEGATDTYSNLQEIDIHDSNINLTVKNEPVMKINMSNVTATESVIENCNSLCLNNGSSPVILDNAKFTTSFTLNVNWTDSIEFNEFEVNQFQIVNTKLNATNNTLIIDGKAKSKFATLQQLTVTGFSHVIIYNCPKLNKVTFADTDLTKIKTIAVVNCSTSASSFSLYSGSATANTINLKAFTSLTDICFMNTVNFENVILPDGFKFKGGEFISCSDLKYLDVLTKAGGSGTATIADTLDKRVFRHLDNSELFSTTNFGIFLNCSKFTLTKSSDNPNVSPIHVSNSISKLDNLFSCASTASTAINLTTISAFINNISASNNITSINSICKNQRGIKLDKVLYISDTKANKSTLCLGIFRRLKDALNAFSPYTGTDSVYINKWIWYDSSKQYVIGDLSTSDELKVTNIFNPFGGINIYQSVDALYPILSKMTSLLGGGGTWLQRVIPVYSNKTETYTVITELTIYKKTQEEEFNNKQYYVKTFTYSGTNANCGDIISEQVSLRNIFVDESKVDSAKYESTKNNAVYPIKISSLNGLNLSINVSWNFYGFISKKWSSLKEISWFLQSTSETVTVAEYEDLLNSTFMPTGLYNVRASFGSKFNNSNTYVDFLRFLDYDTLLSNASNSGKSMVLFSNSDDESITYDTLAINKWVTAVTFRRWYQATINANIKGVRSLFRNCKVIVENSNDVDFKLNPSTTNINNNIITVDRMFYNMSIQTSLKSTTSLYVNFGYDLFKYLPKVTCAYGLFYNNYWSHPIPFNFFNKREYNEKIYYIAEDGIEGRTSITFKEYSYRKELSEIRSCFSNVHWDTSATTKSNTFDKKDVDGKTIEELGYNSYINSRTNEEIKLTSPLSVYISSEGYSTIVLNPSTEYQDMQNLYGSFYQGAYNKTGQQSPITIYPNLVFPLTDDGNVSKYTSNLIVSPDILYGCKSNANISDMFNQETLSSNMLVGILPKHLFKNISSPQSGGIKNIFKKCLVIPNYIGTYTLYRTYTNPEDAEDTTDYIRLSYDVYTFIPEDFITSDSLIDLSNGFNFYMHWPAQGSMIGTGDTARYKYDFYVVSTQKSFTSKIDSLSEAFPSVSTPGSEITTRSSSYINYHSNDFGIHYNLHCYYHTYKELESVEDPYSRTSEEMSNIFGNIYNTNPDICVEIKEFHTGFDMSYYTSLKVDNLITSMYTLNAYFGNIFSESTYILTLSYSSTNSYCITDNSGYTNQYSSNSLSCNVIFPKSNNNSATNFLKFIDSGDTSNKSKYNVWQSSQLQDEDSRTSYQTMFSYSLNLTTGTKNIYYPSE